MIKLLEVRLAVKKTGEIIQEDTGTRTALDLTGDYVLINS